MVLAFAATASVVMGDPWRQWERPEDAGWSSATLAEFRRRAEQMGTGALVLVYDGAVVAAWGNVDRRFGCRSVRKSLVGALVGSHIDAGRLSLNDTLADLGIDDMTALTDAERTATVRDLLMSRSGVYLPAASETSNAVRSRPARGADQPGARWWYNNWGFNVLGTIIEQVGEGSVAEQFARAVAAPLGMEDFGLGSVVEVLEPRSSAHAAAEFMMSARDLARFGQLYLDRGRWEGEQLLSASWVDASMAPQTLFEAGDGYGYLWWSYPAIDDGEQRHAAAQGVGGQFIYVAPDLRTVVVHLRDPGSAPPAAEQEHEVLALIRDLLRERTGESNEARPLVEMRASPFAGAGPAPADRAMQSPSAALIGRVAGEYHSADGQLTVELFQHDGRLFLATSATHRQFELWLDPATSELVAIGNQLTITPTDDGAALEILAFGRATRVAR